jgi:hypothetical protein
MLIDVAAKCQHRSADLLRLTPSGGREMPPPPRGGPLPMHSHRAAPRRRPNRHNGRQITNHHLYASSCQTRRDTPRNLHKDATEPAPRKTLRHRRQTHPRPTKPPTAKNGVLSRLSPFFRFREAPKNGASILLNAVWYECKAWFQADRLTYKKPKKNLKTYNNQTHEQ